jgi:hypothetical protein
MGNVISRYVGNLNEQGREDLNLGAFAIERADGVAAIT